MQWKNIKKGEERKRMNERGVRRKKNGRKKINCKLNKTLERDLLIWIS